MSRPLPAAPRALTAALAAAVLSLLVACPASRAATTLTLVLQPTADATVYENAGGTSANGAGEFLLAGRNNQTLGSRRRSLLQFDLHQLPATALVTAVTLQLHSTPVTTAETRISLFRLLQPWTAGPADPEGNESSGAASSIGDATWLHASFDQSPWSSPGGHSSVIPSASLLVGPAAGPQIWTSPDLAADLAAWRLHPAENFGWLLRDDELTPQTAKRFASADHPDPSLRPLLRIDYQPVPEPAAALLLPVAGLLAFRRRRSAGPTRGTKAAYFSPPASKNNDSCPGPSGHPKPTQTSSSTVHATSSAKA